jgi:hypothetical protein
MDINAIGLGIIKGILGMKFGWLILIAVGTLVGFSLIKNILSGSFNVAKFAGGFNIFTGSVQGKLIYYGLIIFGCFVAYSFIMRPTTSFDTDYKNTIHHNQDVMIDQRVGNSEGCDVNLFFGLIKLGCKQQPITKTVIVTDDSSKVVETPNSITKTQPSGNKGVVTKGKK